ncbi:TetR family transcriptional regulator [Peribacillus simplex]
MSMIAAEAGISQGLSYHYFKSREEIFYFARERSHGRSAGDT